MNKKLIRLTESDLHRIVKESVNKVLNEIDWRTIETAKNKANYDSMDNNLPYGLRTKRGEQFMKFRDSLPDYQTKQYGLTAAQIQAAKKGKGNEYDTANRRELKQMDKLNSDYNNFQAGNSNYVDGNWK